MKSLWLALVMLCVTVPAMRADDASKRVKVEELLIVTHMDQRVTQMREQNLALARERIKQAYAGVAVDAATQKIIDEYLHKMIMLLSTSLVWDKLKAGYVDAYQRTYTEAEVDALLRFYKTPEGHSIADKGADVMSRTSDVINAQEQTLQPAMRKLADEFQAQLTGAGVN